MLDGRVKTLHPKVHGGLLFIRGNETHEAAAKAHGISPIDLVVVNLYPFEQTVAKPDVSCTTRLRTLTSAGLRCCAARQKITTASRSSLTRWIMTKSQSKFPKTETRPWNCAANWRRKFLPARRLTMARLHAHLQKEFKAAQVGVLPATLCDFRAARAAVALRRKSAPSRRRFMDRFKEFFQQLHGKELSYNNILDLTAAAQLIAEFEKDPPTLAILKHTNPCGVGQGTTLREAWEKAFATDKQAPFRRNHRGE